MHNFTVKANEEYHQQAACDVSWKQLDEKLFKWSAYPDIHTAMLYVEKLPSPQGFTNQKNQPKKEFFAFLQRIRITEEKIE